MFIQLGFMSNNVNSLCIYIYIYVFIADDELRGYTGG